MAGTVRKARGQSERNQKVLFQLVDSTGTPSIAKVSPLAAAGDISVIDTNPGLAAITIKNFKGRQGGVNIQLTPRTTSLMSAAVSVSYSGENLAFTFSTENDASTLTDSTVDVSVEVY